MIYCLGEATLKGRGQGTPPSSGLKDKNVMSQGLGSGRSGSPVVVTGWHVGERTVVYLECLGQTQSRAECCVMKSRCYGA